MFGELKEIFLKANNMLLTKDIDLFESRVNERTFCGALAHHFYEVLKDYYYPNYFVDIEYNRNRNGKVKYCKKTIKGPDTSIVTINCDLIFHSRGKEGRDNLIAIEMKKYSHPKKLKDKDKERLRALTAPLPEVYSYDGTALPNYVCGYQLGIYYEINFNKEIIYIEYYSHGEKIADDEIAIFNGTNSELIYN